MGFVMGAVTLFFLVVCNGVRNWGLISLWKSPHFEPHLPNGSSRYVGAMSPIHVPLLRWTTKTTRTLVLALANVVLALTTHPRKHVGDLKLRLFPLLYFLIWMVNRSIDKGQKHWWQSQDGFEDLLWVHCTSMINITNVLFNMARYHLFRGLVYWWIDVKNKIILEKEWQLLWLSHCNFCYSEDF